MSILLQKGGYYKMDKQDVIIYAYIFVIIYFGVMLWEYQANDDLNWLQSFIIMFSITFIYFLLRKTKKSPAD